MWLEWDEGGVGWRLCDGIRDHNRRWTLRFCVLQSYRLCAWRKWFPDLLWKVLSCHLFCGTHMQHFVNAYEENMMGEANNIQNRYSILYIHIRIYLYNTYVIWYVYIFIHYIYIFISIHTSTGTMWRSTALEPVVENNERSNPQLQGRALANRSRSGKFHGISPSRWAPDSSYKWVTEVTTL